MFSGRKNVTPQHTERYISELPLRTTTLSEVTRDSWKSTFKEALSES